MIELIIDGCSYMALACTGHQIHNDQCLVIAGWLGFRSIPMDHFIVNHAVNLQVPKFPSEAEISETPVRITAGGCWRRIRRYPVVVVDNENDTISIIGSNND